MSFTYTVLAEYWGGGLYMYCMSPGAQILGRLEPLGLHEVGASGGPQGGGVEICHVPITLAIGMEVVGYCLCRHSIPM